MWIQSRRRWERRCGVGASRPRDWRRVDATSSPPGIRRSYPSSTAWCCSRSDSSRAAPNRRTELASSSKAGIALFSARLMTCASGRWSDPCADRRPLSDRRWESYSLSRAARADSESGRREARKRTRTSRRRATLNGMAGELSSPLVRLSWRADVAGPASGGAWMRGSWMTVAVARFRLERDGRGRGGDRRACEWTADASCGGRVRGARAAAPRSRRRAVPRL